MKKITNIIILLLVLILNSSFSSTFFTNNTDSRSKLNLDGEWKVSIAPFGGMNGKTASKTFTNEAIDQVFADRLIVPGDWNTQSEKLYYYEGTIAYKKNFKIDKKDNRSYVINFGAVNYEAEVFLNGTEIGSHTGGFTPFLFDISDNLKNGNNTLVVVVNNLRKKDAIPTIRFDWWNYGGITRSVDIAEIPKSHIKDYTLELKDYKKKIVKAVIKLSHANAKNITLKIPEAKVSKVISTNSKGIAEFEFKAKKIKLWSPENPKLYNIEILSGEDKITEDIGFRKIESVNGNILLNGEKVFLKGINIHEEAPMKAGRVTTSEECRTLLNWAKELGCNFVRLAHYPHSELMVKEADKLGLMVWSEIPVYWKINFESKESFNNAKTMLTEMIQRDKNRASIILWSVANETRESEARQKYLTDLLKTTKELDPSRLTTAALEAFKEVDGVRVIDDPLGKYIDVIGVNCYCGWYFRKPNECPDLKWDVQFEKPVIFSEFGAGALQGLHDENAAKWSEEYMDDVYKYNLEMIEKQMPFVDGMTPWLLMDFRSPIRPNRVIQNDYNRKGLISEQGIRKKAFYRLQEYYKNK